MNFKKLFGFGPTQLSIELAQIRVVVVADALKKFNNKTSFFSICEVNKMEEASGIKLDGDTSKKLHLLHCVQWSSMQDGWQEEITKFINEKFGPYAKGAVQ